MTYASRYNSLFRALAAGSLVFVVLGGWLLWCSLARVAPAGGTKRATAIPRYVSMAPKAAIGLKWSVFNGSADTRPQTSGFAKRFRLAGTFFVSGAGGLNIRKAVVDIVQAGTQKIVSEGDHLGDVLVSKILRDRVVLRDGTVEETLWLSFSGSGEAGSTSHSGDTGGTAAAAVTAADVNRFGGTLVQPNNWIFQRTALMSYYNELMDAPERLLQVFDSLKPLYDENRKITGYQLGVEGEGAFFEAAGLKQGDIVRKVNDVEMTNRRRAENFIEQFARNGLNVFVIDIERDGKPMRLVYRVR